MDNNYIIYKALNSITNEVYIGATKSNIEDRMADHLQKANKGIGSYFQQALGTYGPEAFTWAQIDTAKSVNELADKETLYIELHNSLQYGYNSDKGGGFQKTIYRYDLEGNFDRTFETLSEAGLSIGARKQDISRACWSIKKILDGYLWSYDLKEKLVPKLDSRMKVVCQFDLDGNLISKYESASEASRTIGVSKTCITRCCRGERKSTKGSMWAYL